MCEKKVFYWHEDKILNGWCLYMEIVIYHKIRIQSYLESRRMPSDGKSSHCLWQSELKSDRKAKSGGRYMYVVNRLVR
jgi:hypothetical protein